jgi:NodT family efflux transporter outer membrane factor (OMF) lipoprotein
MQRVCLFGALAILSACSISMSQQEISENILDSPSLDLSVKNALENDAFESEDWPEKNWWEAYGSQELNRLIELALCNNPTIQSLRAKVDAAKEFSIIAHSKLLPLIYFNASDAWQYLSKNGLYRILNPDIPLNNQQIDFSLSFSYEFDFWGKYRNLYHAALGREMADLAETAQVELITAVALAQSYFAFKTNQVRKELYQELYEVRKEYYDLQISLRNSAILSDLPPLLSEEAVFEAKQQLESIEEEIAQNMHIVNVLAGIGPDAPILLDEPLPCLPAKLAIPKEIASELLSRRPDLIAEIWRLDALAHEVGAARADFWPNINLTNGILGIQSGSWSDLFKWASKTIGVTPGLSLPVYTAGAISANAGRKKALYDEAVYQYNGLILKSFQEVADLLAIGKSIYSQKQEQEEIVDLASRRTELAKLRAAKGIDNALATLSLFEEQLVRQLKDIQLLYNQYLVSVKLTKALGGGYVQKCKNNV